MFRKLKVSKNICLTILEVSIRFYQSIILNKYLVKKIEEKNNFPLKL